MRVYVYWNVHKKCFSVKALDGAAKGRIVLHAEHVLIRDAEFRVNEKTRQRILATGRKEVHAGIVGTLDGCQGDETKAFRSAYGMLAYSVANNWTGTDKCYAKFAREKGNAVTYNPRRTDCFTREVKPFSFPEHGQRIDRAEMVYCRVEKSGTGAGAVARIARVHAFDPCDMSAAEAPKVEG